MFERGIVMSYETIRQCERKFGPNYDRAPVASCQAPRCLAPG